MAQVPTRVEYYEAPRTTYNDDGDEVLSNEMWVFARTVKDLGNGIVVTVGDRPMDTVADFVAANPRTRVLGYAVRGQGVAEPVQPASITLDKLPGFLAGVGSVDQILDLMVRDNRKGAVPLYQERIGTLILEASPGPEAELAQEIDSLGDRDPEEAVEAEEE